MQLPIKFFKQARIKAVMRLKINFTMTPVVVVDMTAQGAICCDHSLFRRGGSNWASITSG